MHPLRVLLLISLTMAIAIAAAFGYLLHRVVPAVVPLEVVLVSVGVFVAFLIPWAAVFAWAVRRASDLDVLTDRTRRVAEGHYDEVIHNRPFHGELDELARGVEELRAILVRQKESFESHRAAMDQIVASLGEGLLAVDRRGRVVFANRTVGEMFGTEHEVFGRSFLEVVRNQSLVECFDLALRGESSVERLTVAERQIEMRVFPVAGASEIAAVALFIDVTEIERLQRVRKKFLDDFSHEVRTPLAGLRSAAETMEQGGITDQQEEQLRHVMLRQLSRIERLVKDLSELHRIESGELVLDRRNVGLRLLLDDLCEEYRDRLAGNPVRFTVRGDEIMALVDPTRAQQIFSNLLDNAWKHGGTRGEILVELRAQNGEAIVKVSDEGEGIPPAEMERIFNRFYRVDRSRSQETPGAGLGLAIAKHLVLLHGGSIRAYNRPSGGATFEVRFPLHFS